MQAISTRFGQIVRSASAVVEAERSMVVTNFEDEEHREATSRTLRNENECRAVTYFARQVWECFEFSTRVSGISVRVIGQRWYDLEEAPPEIRKKLAAAIEKLPKLGEEARDPTPIALPTDGVLIEPELTHCPSCDPERIVNTR